MKITHKDIKETAKEWRESVAELIKTLCFPGRDKKTGEVNHKYTEKRYKEGFSILRTYIKDTSLYKVLKLDSHKNISRNLISGYLDYVKEYSSTGGFNNTYKHKHIKKYIETLDDITHIFGFVTAVNANFNFKEIAFWNRKEHDETDPKLIGKINKIYTHPDKFSSIATWLNKTSTADERTQYITIIPLIYLFDIRPKEIEKIIRKIKLEGEELIEPSLSQSQITENVKNDLGKFKNKTEEGLNEIHQRMDGMESKAKKKDSEVNERFVKVEDDIQEGKNDRKNIWSKINPRHKSIPLILLLFMSMFLQQNTNSTSITKNLQEQKKDSLEISIMREHSAYKYQISEDTFFYGKTTLLLQVENHSQDTLFLDELALEVKESDLISGGSILPYHTQSHKNEYFSLNIAEGKTHTETDIYEKKLLPGQSSYLNVEISSDEEHMQLYTFALRITGHNNNFKKRNGLSESLKIVM